MGDKWLNLGRQVRSLRKSKNLTIEQLSERIGKSSNFIGNIERGEDTPSIFTLIEIANALNVGTDVLLQDYLTVYNGDFNKAIAGLMNDIEVRQELSKDEMKDISAMFEIMIHFKNLQ